MSATTIDTPEVRQARRDAQRLRKSGLSQHEALDQAAQQRGYLAWKLFLKAQGRQVPAHPTPSFTQRQGIGIHFVGDYVPGQHLDRTVRDGDWVDLRLKTERVQLREVTVLAHGRYSGVIHEFAPSHAEEYEGLREGQRVEFELVHVHGCGHPRLMVGMRA